MQKDAEENSVQHHTIQYERLLSAQKNKTLHLNSLKITLNAQAGTDKQNRNACYLSNHRFSIPIPIYEWAFTSMHPAACWLGDLDHHGRGRDTGPCGTAPMQPAGTQHCSTWPEDNAYEERSGMSHTDTALIGSVWSTCAKLFNYFLEGFVLYTRAIENEHMHSKIFNGETYFCTYFASHHDLKMS